jgi:hypothetical protein
LTANRTAAAAPIPACSSSPSAELRLAKDLEAGAHAQHRSAGQGRRLLHALEAARLAAPQHPRGAEHQGHQHDRRDRGDHERVLVPVEEADRMEHHGAEDHQREDVEEGL